MKLSDDKTRPAPTYAKTPPVPLPAFERISQSVLGMLEAEGANVTASCLFFGLIAESILKRKYGLDARAVVGSASFHLGGPEQIAFSSPEGAVVAVGKENFHCWVEVNGWFLDFSSIVYPEIAVGVWGFPCPRFMFQKPLVKAARSMFELQTKGAFYCCADGALTQDVTAGFRSKQAICEIIEIVTNWYRRPPHKMDKIGFKDQHGYTKPVVVSAQKFDGVW